MSDRFDLWVIRFDADEGDTIASLRELFGLDEATARQLMASTPLTVKRDQDRETAETFGRAFARMDAVTKIVPAGSLPPSEGMSPQEQQRAAVTIPPAARDALGSVDRETLAASARGSVPPKAPPEALAERAREDREQRRKQGADRSKVSQKRILAILAVVLLASGVASFLLSLGGDEGAAGGSLGASETERLASRLKGRADHQTALSWLGSGGTLYRLEPSKARVVVNAAEEAGATEVGVAGYARVGKSGEVMRYLIARVPQGKVGAVAEATARALEDHRRATIRRGKRHVVVELGP